MSTPLDDFINAARERGHSTEYIDKISVYAKRLFDSGYPIIFSAEHLAIEMRMPTRLLNACINLRGRKYSYFKLMKRTGGFREIMTPHEDLKYIQRWILYNVLVKYPLTEACTGFRISHSIETNAKVHAGANVILKVDLLKFYDTITESRVFGIFKAMGYASNLAIVLAKLTTSPHRDEYWDGFSIEEKEILKSLYSQRPSVLPQGAPTSPMLSNIAATHLDKRMAGLAKSYGFNYSRYADDLTFSSTNPNNLPVVSFIKKIIQEEGFFINDKKTLFSRRGTKQYVTGLTVTHGVHISKAYRKAINLHLHYCKKYGPLDHLKKWSEKNNINRDFRGYQHWLLGCISFIYSIDKKNGLKMFGEFNKIDWAI